MTNSQKTAALIRTLTREHALEYAAEAEKIIWIETSLLDVAGISRSMAERVEDALEAILESLTAEERAVGEFSANLRAGRVAMASFAIVIFQLVDKHGADFETVWKACDALTSEQFEVVRHWATGDSVHEEVVELHYTADNAEKAAEVLRRGLPMAWSGYTVRKWRRPGS